MCVLWHVLTLTHTCKHISGWGWKDEEAGIEGLQLQRLLGQLSEAWCQNKNFKDTFQVYLS